MPYRLLLLLILSITVLSACSSAKKVSRGGGYYKDDGPGTNIPANILATPNAVPRIETPRPANARPYRVMGKNYTPISSNQNFKQHGIASWYGRKFHGNKTATGEIYDMYAMTAAHPTLPLPSYARVTHAHTNKSVIVRVNDRGPFHSDRIIDLSYVAAAKLDLIGPGSGPVIVEAITNQDIQKQAYVQKPETNTNTKPIVAETQPESNTDVLLALNTQTTSQASNNEEAVFLQYGAFSVAENAAKLAGKINQSIVNIEHRRANVYFNNNIHRVHIGPYENRTHAVNAALRIQAETGLDASFTRVPH